MTEQKNKPHEELIPCEVCMKEIPRSEAKVEEAADYVAYFCGLECFDKWRKEADKSD
ncbi:MAG: DUF3330 domain-containing protein [Gammaproteobacteria bacterium]|nr:DUF3330 domain-containing protein [Gammaproteobacteria bacterium]